MPYSNTAPYSRPSYQPRLPFQPGQDSDLGGHVQSKLGEFYQMNLSQYSDDRLSSMQATGLSGEPQSFSSHRIEASNSFPPPPFPPAHSPDTDRLTSIGSRADHFQHDARQNMKSPSPAPFSNSPAIQSTGNDPGKSDASSTSEMDLEDGEVSDEGSGQVSPNVVQAEHLERVELNTPYATSASVIEMRRRASAALKDLHAQRIDFAALLEEGIDQKTLVDLYRETGISIPKIYENRTDSEIPGKQSLEPLSSGKAQVVQNHEQSQLPTPKASWDLPSSSNIPVLKDVVGRKNKQGQSFDDFADVASQPKPMDRPVPHLESLGQKPKALDPASIPTVETPVAVNKAMDRKDYIARMLEARKKNLPKSTPLSESPVLVTKEVTPPTSKSKTFDEASSSSFVNTAVAIGAATQTPGNQRSSTSFMPSRTRNSDQSAKVQSELEAKKKAQTELARQKMEALLKRGQSKTTNTHQPRPSKSLNTHQVSQNPQYSKEASVPTSASSLPQALESAERSSIISPSQATPFSIPGLFTSANRPVSHTEPSVTTSVSTPRAATARTPGEDPPSRSSGEPHHIKLSTSNGTMSANVNNSDLGEGHSKSIRVTGSRKRQKAADFIDSPPSRSKRRLGSGDDTSVIIEVSDDELYGDTQEEAADTLLRQITPQPPAIEVGNPADNISFPSPPTKSSALADAPPITPSRGLGATRDSTPNGTKGLKSKEKEIEEMQRRIAELEQRKKTKSRTSRAQTPGSPPKESVLSPLRNAPSPSVPILPSKVESSNDKSKAVTHATSDATCNADFSINSFSGPSSTARHEQEEPDASYATSKTLQPSLDQHDDPGRTSESTSSSSSSPPKQAQHQQVTSIRASDAVSSKMKESVGPTTLSTASSLTVLEPPEQLDPILNPSNNGKPLPSIAAKNILASGDLEVHTAMLRLEQLRAEMALLEKQLQAGTQGGENTAKGSEKSMPTDIPPPTGSGASLPKAVTAPPTDSVQQEAAIKSVDAKDSASNDAIEPQQATRSGAPQSGLPLDEQVGFEGLAPKVDNGEPTEGEYDPTEDAMDLSDNNSEQDEIIKGVHDGQPVTLTERTADGHTLEYVNPTNTHTGETYEPPLTFEDHSALFNNPSSVSDYEPQDKDSADTVGDTAVNHNANDSTRGDCHQENTTMEPPATGEASPALAHATSSADTNSSEDDSAEESEYEPPAPELPMDLNPPTSDNAIQMTDVPETVLDLGITSTLPTALAEEKDSLKLDAPELVRPKSKIPTFDPILSGKQYTPYKSPLKLFKDYRYHPKFLTEASQGFRSNTYSNSLDDKTPLCPYGTLGTCNDPVCRFQHLDKVKLSGASRTAQDNMSIEVLLLSLLFIPTSPKRPLVVGFLNLFIRNVHISRLHVPGGCTSADLRMLTILDDKILVQLGSAPASMNPEQQEKFREGLRNLIGQMRIRNVRDFSQLVAEIVAFRQDFLGDKSKVLAL